MTNNPPLAQLAEATALNPVQSEFESLRGDHPIYKSWKIYGPYTSKIDRRLRVVAYNGSRRVTISYPKFMLEAKLGRVLKVNEEAHHIDGNIDNNLLFNFGIENSTEHRILHNEKQELQHGTRKMARDLRCRCLECRRFIRSWGH